MTPSRLLAVAVAIGAAFQALFFGELPGLNVVLVAGATLAAGFLARRGPLHPADRWLPVAALAFAAFPALRTEVPLVVFDVLAALALLLACAVALSGMPVTPRPFVAIVALGASATARATVDGGSLLAEGRPRLGGAEPLLPYGRGLLIALPLVAAFSFLFGSADAVFGRVVGDLVDPRLWVERLGDVPGRLALGLVAGWLVAGGLVIARRGVGDVPAPPARTRASRVEALVVVVAVDVLFAFFVALQLAYLFGGRDTLEAAGLTYSEYARRGFFELLQAAALAGAIVLALEWLRERSRALLAAEYVLLAGTAAVLVSSLYRMQLYQTAYGWSELRVFAIAGIAWLALCVVAAALCLSRDLGRWLPHAVVVSGFVVAAATNVVGPAELSARANAARFLHPEVIPADGERRVDVPYLMTLGDAGIPSLVELLPSLDEPERRSVDCWFGYRAREDRHDSLASWSYERARARAALDRIVIPPCPSTPRVR